MTNIYNSFCTLFCCYHKEEVIPSLPISSLNTVTRNLPTPIDPVSLSHINDLALYIATHSDVFTLANTIATSF